MNKWIIAIADTSLDGIIINRFNGNKKEVKEFIYNMLDNLLSNYDIDYIKWDVNRPICEGGATNLGEN